MAEITIKGVRDGLLITLNEGDPWPETMAALLTRIDQSVEFFKGAKIALAVGGRALPAADLGRLRDAFSERHVTLWTVLSESPLTVKTAQALGLNIALPTSAPQAAQKPEKEIDPEEAGDAAVLLRRTLRSGRSVQHPGHVIVLGDVNPGAEITAGGDVIVWGRLRGTVHAGANGDTSAVICALDLSPTQLRIAHQIAISPAHRGHPQPEAARIKNGQIVAERWKPGDK